MFKYILKRLGIALLVALTVSIISFSLLYISSDPAVAMAGETASDEDIEALRKLYGFDKPAYERFVEMIFGFLKLSPKTSRQKISPRG